MRRPTPATHRGERPANKFRLDNDGRHGVHENSNPHETTQTPIYRWILLITFAAIVIWVFGRKREARCEKDARISLEDKER